MRVIAAVPNLIVHVAMFRLNLDGVLLSVQDIILDVCYLGLIEFFDLNYQVFFNYMCAAPRFILSTLVTKFLRRMP